jgi:HK97 family phage prohead protease
MIRFNAADISITAKAGSGRREISGVAVPYNVEAQVSTGQAVIFRPGSLPVEGKAPRLFMYHDATMPVGVVTERVDTPDGMMFTAKVSASSQGQDAMIMLTEGVIDQVSVGVNPTLFSFNDAGTMIVEAADWLELSLVPVGAFGDAAAITDVAASIHQDPEEIGNTEEQTPQEETPEMEAAPVEAAVEATIPTAPIPAQPRREFKMPSAAEYMAAMHIGGDTFRNVNAAFVEAQKRQASALQAAAGDIATTDTPGLLPVPVLGPLFQDLNFVRPVVTALGARSMPNTPSKTFIRPTITTHTSAAQQSSEFAAVSATTMVIASNVVTKTTVAGQVTLSAQDIDFTDPAALQLVLNDLAGEYLIATDNIAADNMVAGKTASGSTWTVTAGNPTSLMNSLYDAAREIAEDSNYFPTHLFVSPDVWEKLGSQLDSTYRPLFPAVNGQNIVQQNGIGTASGALNYNSMNPLGLQLVVDNNFASGTMLVVYAPGFEVYEQQRGLMSVEAPSTLGRVFSYYGYFATFVAKSSFIQSITIA